MSRLRSVVVSLALGALILEPQAARAILDIEDRGPVLMAGSCALRVTNAGILGNAFYDRGLSFDPSFEYPRGSGHEALNHAELWVGAARPDGRVRVSGGPMLEWRPTLDAADRVRTAWTGSPGTRRRLDEDNDGRTDEEILNGADDDGDGRVDEDLGIPCDQLTAAEYADDNPGATDYVYSTGETHDPLGLSVHQEAYSWAVEGYDNIIGLHFTVTNHGSENLEQVYLGLYCDLDSRNRDGAGHLDDRIVDKDYGLAVWRGLSAFGSFIKPCYDRKSGRIPVVYDGVPGSGLPASAIVPLTHTTDPLAWIKNFQFIGARAAHDAARAPRRDTTFRFSVFTQDMPPGQGGPPRLDTDRYLALAGAYPEAARDERPHDWAVLLSCGPFARLAPGESLQFEAALVVADDPGALTTTMARAALLHFGYRRNQVPDGITRWNQGVSYVGGHEICYEPPEGITFEYDPHCPEKFVQDSAYFPLPGIPPGGDAPPAAVIYQHGKCVWTDFDCDACTGWGGAETHYRWLNPGWVPPPPARSTVPGDRQVTIRWDNRPEILLAAGVAGDSGFAFAGYNLYRLSKWRRVSEIPPPSQWELVAAYRPDSAEHSIPLHTIEDPSVAPDAVEYGQEHYPIGRYQVVDREVLNGFDYMYMLTTVAERQPPPGGQIMRERLETPIIASLDSLVRPSFDARQDASGVWVVPNPYRVRASWDRPPVPGDIFTRHVDFCGLPRAHCTIRIYTVAGDFVAQVDHDGSDGNGQAPWNLISRNGQDVESGIYLFAVDSPLGHTVGKFVIIR